MAPTDHTMKATPKKRDDDRGKAAPAAAAPGYPKQRVKATLEAA